MNCTRCYAANPDGLSACARCGWGLTPPRATPPGTPRAGAYFVSPPPVMGTVSGAATGAGALVATPPPARTASPTPGHNVTAQNRATGDSGEELLALGDSAVLEIEEGRKITDRYTVIRRIGHGGMGAVYAVSDAVRTNVTVALKVMKPSLTSSPKHVKRFKNEFELVLKIRNKHVVQVYEPGFDAARGLHFFTMEYINGYSLRDFISVRVTESLPVPIDEALAIVRQIFEGLKEAHAEAVHRDLKPENVMVDDRGLVRILDFGIAKDLEAGLTTMGGGAHGAMGTVSYMAPEQTVGNQDVDARADIYAAFMILYELLTLRHRNDGLGKGKEVRFHRPEVPRALSDLIEAALLTDRDRRPASAEDSLRLLRASMAPARVWPRAVASIALVGALAIAGVQGHRSGLFGVVEQSKGGSTGTGSGTPPIDGDSKQSREPKQDPEPDSIESVTKSAEVVVMSDDTPPSLTLNAVPTGPVNRKELEVRGRVFDTGTPAKGLSVSVAGKPVQIASDGSFEVVIGLGMEGPNEFEVTASDGAKNSTSTVLTVVRDMKKPEVTLSDVVSETEAESVTISGRVDELGATVEIDGRDISVKGDRFLGTAALPAVGLHEFKVSAMDPAGNTSEPKVVNVKRVARLPLPLPGVSRSDDQSVFLHRFNGRPSAPMAFVPGGRVSIEGKAIEVAPFYMDRFEVTVGEYDAFLRSAEAEVLLKEAFRLGDGEAWIARAKARGEVAVFPEIGKDLVPFETWAQLYESALALGPSFPWARSGRVYGPNPPPRDPRHGYLRHPVTGVSWFEAAAYALYVGKELPSEAQWELAARGPQGREYPWGSEKVPPSRQHASFLGGAELGVVDGLQAGRTPDTGIYGLAGGVAEWCADWFDAAETQRSIRGGAFDEPPESLRSATRSGIEPVARYSIGLRCVRWR